jgi:hypothetical protein
LVRQLEPTSTQDTFFGCSLLQEVLLLNPTFRRSSRAEGEGGPGAGPTGPVHLGYTAPANTLRLSRRLEAAAAAAASLTETVTVTTPARGPSLRARASHRPGPRSGGEGRTDGARNQAVWRPPTGKAADCPWLQIVITSTECPLTGAVVWRSRCEDRHGVTVKFGADVPLLRLV